jgi:DNA helicase II / ATP-dependent DNA helicase PcrA
MTATPLDRAWSELSDLQRNAAEWDRGALLVLAGPGSGKTRVLTSRVARLLDKTREENFRVLCLTFTNKAADEMRTRVTVLVPGEERRLFLGTFHSFCAEILRQHGSHVGIRPNFTIYSQDTDLEAILADAVDGAKRESPIVSDLDKKTLPVILRLKSLLVFPNECKQAIKDQELGERMSIVYPAYEKELLNHNALDFSSLILRAYELFQRYPAFSKRYRAVYPFVCVDEFQDTNDAQYKLLQHLVGEQERNVFVVADDDQIIYQWNGASHKRIEDLVASYHPTVMQLPVNYRCPAEIVVLANNLIRHNFLRTQDKKPLVAFQGDAGADTVRLLRVFDSEQAEATGVACDIKERRSGQLNAVVVLGRNRRLLVGVENALRQEGIASVIAQRKDEFESAPLAWLHSMLRLANSTRSREMLAAVCGSFKQITGIEIDDEEVAVEAEASQLGLLRCWTKRVEMASLDQPTKKVIAGAVKHLGGGSEFLRFGEDAIGWFDVLVQAAGDQSEEVFARYAEEREVWQSLVREITWALGPEIGLEAFLHELQMRSKESLPKGNTVRLFTIHASKGKEFDHVYLIGLVEDELPSFQSIKKGDRSPEMEEERRNCFVAITRTSKSLTMSYAKLYRGWQKQPSRFLREMGILGRK